MSIKSSRSRSQYRAQLLLVFAMRSVVLLLPAAILLMGVYRTSGQSQTMLTLGACFQIIVCGFTLLSWQSWLKPLAPSVITLYSIALGWLWLVSIELMDWYLHLSQAILLTVPLVAFGVQLFVYSGAPVLRRARILAQKLADRKEWPTDLAACRTLPEVKALREAMHLDAAPALNLLQHPRLPVRVAALAALEFRKNWRPGEAELVFQVAMSAKDSAVRAGAVTALANLDDRAQIESLAEFMMDPVADVRRAAAEAVLWDSEHRWCLIRSAVCQSLAKPAHQADGALPFTGDVMPADVLADLKAWAGEKTLLGMRAAQTLGAHYARRLSEKTDEMLVDDLQSQLSNPLAPPVLRVEVAQVLQNRGKWDGSLQVSLLSPANPTSLRLLAAEALLTQGSHPLAVAALQDIARQPNRELALATAEVIQRCLGIDMGLPPGNALPASHTRQAADIARRVMLWAVNPQADQAQNQSAHVRSERSDLSLR